MFGEFSHLWSSGHLPFLFHIRYFYLEMSIYRSISFKYNIVRDMNLRSCLFCYCQRVAGVNSLCKIQYVSSFFDLWRTMRTVTGSNRSRHNEMDQGESRGCVARKTSKLCAVCRAATKERNPSPQQHIHCISRGSNEKVRKKG